ncbi:MAG: HemK family protein methyltransferase [Patescibacteria group bacterium]
MLKEKKILKTQLPFEYSEGFVDFLGCRIDLSQRIFIPRVETEFWLKRAIKEIKTKSRKLKTKGREFLVLDVFSGSGCIGIAIQKACPEYFKMIDFGDIDKRALRQIKINLGLNKIKQNRVKIIKTNIFSGIKGRYDYIFANPPYVAKERLKEVHPSVKKYEPKIALLGGREGLEIISKFLGKAKRFLRRNGIIYMEIDSRQKRIIEDILRGYGYKEFKFYRDQFKKYRWIKIFKTRTSKRSKNAKNI